MLSLTNVPEIERVVQALLERVHSTELPEQHEGQSIEDHTREIILALRAKAIQTLARVAPRPGPLSGKARQVLMMSLQKKRATATMVKNG